MNLHKKVTTLFLLFTFLFCEISCAAEADSIEKLSIITPENSELYGVRIYIGGSDLDIHIKIKALSENRYTNLKANGMFLTLKKHDEKSSYLDAKLETCKSESDVLMSRVRIDVEHIDDLYLGINYSVLDKEKKQNSYNLTSELYDWDFVGGVTEARKIDLFAFLNIAKSVEFQKKGDQNWWLGVGVDVSKSESKAFDRSIECM